MDHKHARKKRRDIYDRYREALAKLELSTEAIDEMREHVARLARTICEHVWDGKFY